MVVAERFSEILLVVKMYQPLFQRHLMPCQRGVNPLAMMHPHVLAGYLYERFFCQESNMRYIKVCVHSEYFHSEYFHSEYFHSEYFNILFYFIFYSNQFVYISVNHYVKITNRCCSSQDSCRCCELHTCN